MNATGVAVLLTLGDIDEAISGLLTVPTGFSRIDAVPPRKLRRYRSLHHAVSAAPAWLQRSARRRASRWLITGCAAGAL
ncbi:MAG: hypothetical protein WCI78_13365, partial [Mycobacterium sp.]